MVAFVFTVMLQVTVFAEVHPDHALKVWVPAACGRRDGDGRAGVIGAREARAAVGRAVVVWRARPSCLLRWLDRRYSR